MPQSVICNSDDKICTCTSSQTQQSKLHHFYEQNVSFCTYVSVSEGHNILLYRRLENSSSPYINYSFKVCVHIVSDSAWIQTTMNVNQHDLSVMVCLLSRLSAKDL